jgi:MFS family permease
MATRFFVRQLARPLRYHSRVKLAVLKAFREHPEVRRLALIFGVVYFAQGMGNLPVQPITFTLKERFGFSAAQTAAFFSLTVIPWLIKPVYGLISDCVPLFGRRRKSYLLGTSALAATAGFGLSLVGTYTTENLALLFTLTGLGLAFTDVMVDALMVENGRPLGLTGAFQSVQWSSIYAASILVGVAGGYLTEHAPLQVAFALAAVFPLLSFTVALWAVREPPAATRGPQFPQTWLAIKSGFRSRHLWIIAGFIFFWTFSPSIGTALFYYQTDVLKFSQQFIGGLSSIASASAIAGALLYGVFSKSFPFRWILNSAIGVGVVSTLGYLGYVGPYSAIVLDAAFGAVGMVATLAFLDLAAKACPKQAEGTFFALLMSVYNGGAQLSQIIGGWLYDQVGYSNLILISAAFTALCWFLVPLLKLEELETQARQAVLTTSASASS